MTRSDDQLKPEERAKRNQLRKEKPRVYEKILKYDEKIKRGESVAIIQFQYDYTCNFQCRHCCITKLRKKGAERCFTIPDVKELSRQADEMGLAHLVITGGEPCLQKDLIKFIKKIKALGYLIKLDTNGSYPEVLSGLIKEKLIDYIAMDLKAPEYKYGIVTEVDVNFNNIKKSVKIIMTSGLPYEFRTTVVPELLDKNDINEMGKIIKGTEKWYLQNFKSQSDFVNQKLKGRVPYNSRQMKEMAEIGRKYAKICEVR